MGETYKTLALTVQEMPLGEADRLLTLLSPDRGLIKAVAVGARKPRAKLGGRSRLFVVNQVLLAPGRTFQRLVQAETLESYPGLATTLGKLTAGQYLLELTLAQALEKHPQEELFTTICHSLHHLEEARDPQVLPIFIQASFNLLTLAGLAPQVYYCGRTRQRVEPNFNQRSWRVGFSLAGGGIISLDFNLTPAASGKEPSGPQAPPVTPLTALELATLQALAHPQTIVTRTPAPLPEVPLAVWYKLETLLRAYAQYHLDRPLQSALLLDSCWQTLKIEQSSG